MYDNLNKAIFTPVPVFIDSLGNFILLDWQYLYKGTIRDFYPSSHLLPDHQYQVYIESLVNNPEIIEQAIDAVGQKIQPAEFKNHIDFAFLCLHGPYGEDGNLQGLLEWYDIPYSGAGILPSAIGIDKQVQKHLLQRAGFEVPEYSVITKDRWVSDQKKILKKFKKAPFPVVIKSPHQGSSIGISIVTEFDDLKDSINRAFFRISIDLKEWQGLSSEDKAGFMVSFTDIRDGLGFPVKSGDTIFYDPETLQKHLDKCKDNSIELESLNTENAIIVEEFIKGKEFSCIVIENEKGIPVALPPTGIIKDKELFDYRSKYLPGISRKQTPIKLNSTAVRRIQKRCEKLFDEIHCQVYARIDGFYASNGTIYLNDPNTTSGMLPSSFFFHQAAEIGLNPSEFLSYIIHTSLRARMNDGKAIHLKHTLMRKLEEDLDRQKGSDRNKKKVAVIMGGYSAERHISVESGRNIYEKLSSSINYSPFPVFLTGDTKKHQLFQLPINIMLKDNADDIKDKIEVGKEREVESKYFGIIDQFKIHQDTHIEKINFKELAKRVNFAFIALHGRPGEDGQIQKELEKVGIPYNGSGVQSSQITINKYETNEILRSNGFNVAEHFLARKKTKNLSGKIEDQFTYPFIAKPSDDGCSAAVKKINDEEELNAYMEMMFRPTTKFLDNASRVLKLKSNEEFPQKDYFLVEELIESKQADRFLEITGGLYTSYDKSGKIRYHVFEPSEVLATGEVLSLEEKFLAGEGQNITPARFSKDPGVQKAVSTRVKNVFKKLASTLQVEGYCRIDAFVRINDKKAETVIIEVNSLPGMTPATAIFHQAALSDLKPAEFINKIIDFGTKRNEIAAN